ncbi:MAG: hypothetical protein JWQ11_3243, partial [Rhizobacter sp.]|nr:hypothetical protein [Rhizobacter sp.]
MRALAYPAALLLVAATVMLLGGCGGSSDDAANVRLVNATSDFASLDLYNDTTLLSSGTTSYATGAYEDVDAATIAFNLRSTSSATTAATLSEAVVKSDYYSIVAYSNAGVLKTAFITEDQATPTAGTASIRLMNTASTNAGSVDAYLVTTACSALSTSSASAFASTVAGTCAFVSATAATAGTAYHLCVTAAGDKTDL